MAYLVDGSIGFFGHLLTLIVYLSNDDNYYYIRADAVKKIEEQHSRLETSYVG